MWNHPAVDRVNLWGWITGETWRHDQGYVTGLIDRDGTNKRPAFEWLEEFFDFEDSSTAESNETDSSTSNINYTSYWQKV
jgi:hypothetical protein